MSDEYIALEESKFEDAETEEEYFNVASNFDDWNEVLLEVQEELNNDYDKLGSKILYDAYLGRLRDFCKEVDIYMLGPIAKYGTKTLLARTRQANSVDQILELLDPKKIALYQITEVRDFQDNSIKYHVRYAELEDDE